MMDTSRESAGQRVVFRFGQHSLRALKSALIVGPSGLLALMLSGPNPLSLFLVAVSGLSTFIYLRSRVVLTADAIEVRNWIRTERFPLTNSKTEFWFPGEPAWWHSGKACAMHVRWDRGYWTYAVAASGPRQAGANAKLHSLRGMIERRSDGQAKITIGGTPPWKGSRE